MPRRALRSAATAPTLDRFLTYRLHLLNKLSDRASHEAYLADCGLPLGEARCLAAAGSFPWLTVNELAFEANLDKAQASRAAQSLIDKGLLAKQPSEHDARSVQLSLTPAGRTRWKKVMAVVARRNAEIFGCLNASERELLGQLFDRLIAQSRGQTDGAPEVPQAQPAAPAPST